MNLVILIGLVVIGMIHAARGAVRVLGSGPARPAAAGGSAAPAAVGLLLAAIGLLVGWSAALPVPVGYAGGAGGLSLDPLGCTLLILLLAMACACETDRVRNRIADGHRDLRVAAMMLAFLAGDAFLLACGAILATLLPATLAGRRGARQAAGAALAIAGACALLSGLSALPDALLADPGFALLRAGGGAAPILLPVLVILAAMPLLGLWPAQAAFRHQCAFAPVWVPVSGALLGLFLLLRLLLDLAGPVPSAAWGAMLVLLGAGSALRAGVSALSEPRGCAVLGSVLSVQTGLGVSGIGLCLLARSNDLPALAASSLDAVMLLLPALVPGGLCGLSLMRAVEREAGSGLLARSGGLARSMPLACSALLLPVLLLGAVPPATGFASDWLLGQCVLATQLPLPGGVALPSLLLMLALAGAVALAGGALLRLCWVAGLGRPRTPRCAAATDLAPQALRRHLAPLSLPLLVGLCPGAWLALVAGPAADAVGNGVARRPLLTLLSPAGGGALSPLLLALLLGFCLASAALLARLWSVRAERRQRGWEGGAPAPPPWLPFGDPATQIAPATLPLALRQALHQALGGGHRTRPRRQRRSRAAAAIRVWLRRLRHGSERVRAMLLGRGAMLAGLALGAALFVCLWDAGTGAGPFAR